MIARTTTVLVGMLWMAAVALPVAQAPVTKANVVTISATIQAMTATVPRSHNQSTWQP